MGVHYERVGKTEVFAGSKPSGYTMAKQGCIYLITCLVSGKQYVGLSKDPDERVRYRHHWTSARNNLHDCILYRAMRKHGAENFKVERLCGVSHEGLSNMESYYAEQLGTYVWDIPGGYNMIPCGGIGRLGMKMSKRTKNKIRDAHVGRKVTEEGKERMSAAQTLRFQLNPAPPCSDEQKVKLSESNKGKKRTEETKQNIRASKVAYFETRTEEERQAHVERATVIYQNVKDRLNSREAIEKRRVKLTGKKRTEETKKLLSELAKQRPHQNPPPKPTEESKRIQSEMMKVTCEKWWNEKFNIETIRSIRELYATTKISQVNLAKEYNINVKTMIRIIKREVFPDI